MNQLDLEGRVRVLEARLSFVMNTISMARRNNSTGAVDSRTLDQLYEEAAAHAVDGKTLAEVAAGAFSKPPGGNSPAVGDRSAPGPDGYPGDGTADDRQLELPLSGERAIAE